MIALEGYVIVTNGVNTHACGFGQMVLFKQFLDENEASGGKSKPLGGTKYVSHFNETIA